MLPPLPEPSSLNCRAQNSRQPRHHWYGISTLQRRLAARPRVDRTSMCSIAISPPWVPSGPFLKPPVLLLLCQSVLCKQRSCTGCRRQRIPGGSDLTFAYRVPSLSPTVAIPKLFTWSPSCRIRLLSDTRPTVLQCPPLLSPQLAAPRLGPVYRSVVGHSPPVPYHPDRARCPPTAVVVPALSVYHCSYHSCPQRFAIRHT